MRSVVRPLPQAESGRQVANRRLACLTALPDRAPPPDAGGIDWDALPASAVDEMPVLAELRALRRR